MGAKYTDAQKNASMKYLGEKLTASKSEPPKAQKSAGGKLQRRRAHP